MESRAEEGTLTFEPAPEDGLFTYPAVQPPQPAAARKADLRQDLQQLEGSLGTLPEVFQEGAAIWWVGQFICLAIAVEGALLLYCLYTTRKHALDLHEAIPHWTGLGSQNPLQGLLEIALYTVAYGDIVCGASQAFNQWFFTTLEPPRYVEKLRARIACLAPYSVGVLLWWRALVTLAAAPFCGIMLAFESPQQATATSFICCFIYIALSLMVIYALIYCTHAARVQSRLLQLDDALAGESLSKEVKTGPKSSLPISYSSNEPMILGCIPLSLLVTLYMLTIGIACLIWFLQMIIWETKVVGGWDFVSTKGNGQAPRIVEIIICAVTWAFTIVGFISMASFNRSEREEEYLKVALHNEIVTGTDSGLAASLAVELDAVRHSKRESNNAMLTFLVITLFRIVVFIPLTGMELFEQNLCGFTSSSMQSMYYRSPAALLKARCSRQDALAIVSTLIFCLADLVFLRGLYLLWAHNCQRCKKLDLEKLDKTLKQALDYGTSEPRAAYAQEQGTLLTRGLRAA